jgi:hypothetical protein
MDGQLPPNAAAWLMSPREQTRNHP